MALKQQTLKPESLAVRGWERGGESGGPRAGRWWWGGACKLALALQRGVS